MRPNKSLYCLARLLSRLSRSQQPYHKLIAFSSTLGISLFGALFLIVLAAAGPDLPPPSFSKEFSERYLTETEEAFEFDPSTPLEDAVEVVSPLGHSKLVITRTDGAAIPYDQSRASFEVETLYGENIYFNSFGFRAIEATWLSERFLFIRQNLGHVVGTEEVYDVVDRKWLRQTTAAYGK